MTEPGKSRSNASEAQIQAAIVAWIRQCAPAALVFAIPNGGWRTPREAALLKWTGVMAGIPDLCVVSPTGRVFFIEVKTLRGALAPDQVRIAFQLGTMGIRCFVARSIDETREIFRVMGVRTREAA